MPWLNPWCQILYMQPLPTSCRQRKAQPASPPCAQIVYEFLLRYVVSNDTDAKTAKKYIDQFFVVRARHSTSQLFIQGPSSTGRTGMLLCSTHS